MMFAGSGSCFIVILSISSPACATTLNISFILSLYPLPGYSSIQYNVFIIHKSSFIPCPNSQIEPQLWFSDIKTSDFFVSLAMVFKFSASTHSLCFKIWFFWLHWLKISFFRRSYPANLILERCCLLNSNRLNHFYSSQYCWMQSKAKQYKAREWLNAIPSLN
jgi:hypothetical protein